ncbi:MAG TPA: DUF1080 domain-containing protein [Isosphaeraceae bacterium]|jgi:hypothetical protein|nr:DUF1080 domain-containing protein [Isosphaeraceae bacterium]
MNRLIRGIALLACAIVVPISMSGGGSETAAAQDSKDGWVSLFDGKTLSGWEFLPLRPGSKTNWEVQDGAITGSGEPSMLFSPKGDYKNFQFRAEVKINDHGNSGLYFRTAKKPSFSDGYEAQIDSSHNDPIRTGSIYTLVHIYKQLVPPDTWFTYEIDAQDREYRAKTVTVIKVKVNGDLLYEYLDHDQLFKTGHFAFQQHDPGSKVQIRKIEVKELP